LVQAGDAARLRAGMLRRGVLVRDCASFGLPEWVRIAVPRPRDRDPVLRAFLDAAREGR
jgi:threonine-phosphate decarboxylase